MGRTGLCAQGERWLGQTSIDRAHLSRLLMQHPRLHHVLSCLVTGLLLINVSGVAPDDVVVFGFGWLGTFGLCAAAGLSIGVGRDERT